MLQIDPSPERSKLGFKDSVLDSFRFLGDLGFRPVQEKVTFVRYESPTVFVNIYHGRASFELGVEIGVLCEPTEQVTLYDIVAWADALKVEGFGQHVMFQVSSREGVQQFVPKLADLVRRYGEPFLRGNTTAYTEVLEARSRAARAYERQVQLDDLRRRAETAWDSKDFAGVVELYGAIGPDMTSVEAKRLAYAEKQVRANNTVFFSPAKQ
jgi:hypothetical protein